MKYTVNNACRDLAGQIFDAGLAGDVNLELVLLRRADRIENRFKCVGLTDSKVSALVARRNSFLQAESAAHDRIRPDRRTYLHR